MKTLTSLVILLGLLPVSLWAQEDITGKIDEITTKWDSEAEILSTYAGLGKYCKSGEYRTQIQGLLREIHHYDSILYDRVVKKARYGNNKEIRETLKDIEKMRVGYGTKDFILFLREECHDWKEVEKEKRTDAGQYDGDVYMLETEMNKYVKKITKRIDLIREHSHHLKLD